MLLNRGWVRRSVAGGDGLLVDCGGADASRGGANSLDELTDRFRSLEAGAREEVQQAEGVAVGGAAHNKIPTGCSIDHRSVPLQAPFLSSRETPFLACTTLNSSARTSARSYYQYVPNGMEYPVYPETKALWWFSMMFHLSDWEKEEVLLDWNEITEKFGYVHIESCRISPDHRFLAYTLNYS